MALKWENINLTIENKENSLNLLKGVSGFANPHEVLAIIGVSGSGKTSLLSILSNELHIKGAYTLSGNLFLNNVHYSQTHPNRFIRYIPQENHLFDFLTPRETIEFFGSLQCNLPPERLKQKVDHILNDLKLDKVADSIVGNSIFKGLSGGEKKRVSIGLNLIADPSILILDEPTSGLDSSIAQNVMELIKSMCKYGVTIVMTVHQPSYGILNLIDRMIVMQEGAFVYQGRTFDSIQYLEKIGLAVPQQINLTDYFMKLTKIVDRYNKSDEEIRRINLLNEKYKENEVDIWKEMKVVRLDNFVYEESEPKVSFVKSYLILLWKKIISIKRNPIIIGFNLFQSIGIGIVIIFTYAELDYDSVGMENRYGALIFIMVNLWVMTSILYSLLISNENEIIKRDTKNQLYTLNSYFLSFLTIAMAIGFITTVLFSLIIYWICDFNNEYNSKFFNFVGIGYMTLVLAQITSIFIASISKSIIEATFIAPSIAIIHGVFACLFTDIDSSPYAFRWTKYITPVFYLKRAFYKNEFEDLDYDKDVLPKPKDRFDQKGDIIDNVLITLIHGFASYFIAWSIFYYRSKSQGVTIHKGIRIVK